MTSQTVECTGDLGKNGLIKKTEIPDSYPPRARLNLTPKHINSDWVRVCWNTSVRLLPIFSPNLALFGQIWLFYVPRGWGGGELLGLIFAGYVPLASQNPYLIIVYSVTILVTLGNK